MALRNNSTRAYRCSRNWLRSSYSFLPMSKANQILPEFPNFVSDVRYPFRSRERNNSRRVRPPLLPPSQNRAKPEDSQDASLHSRRSKSLSPERSFAPRTEPTDKDVCSSDKDFEWNECQTAIAMPGKCPRIPGPPTSSPGSWGRAYANPTTPDNDRAPTARAHPRLRYFL